MCGIAWENMMEIGRGGACVPARVAPQGRIHRPSSAHNACAFGMETPLRGRPGGHTGTAPTVSFGWIAGGWLISFWMNYAWGGWFRLSGLRVNGYFVCVGLRGQI